MITVRAPATTANLGSGYDVFGAALTRPADVVRVERADQTTLEVTGTGSRFIPEDPEANTAGVVAKTLDAPAHIHVDKGVRPSSGLGSSAASAAGTALALNELYDLGYSTEELVDVAAEGEAVAAGDAHRDNVAPALLGGFTIVAESGVTQVDASVPLVACLPDLVVSTRDARRVVPAQFPVEDVIETVGNAATLVSGMFRNDPTLVGNGMADRSVTPARAQLIEGYERVRKAALDAGATGVTVSGSGPTVVAACYQEDRRTIAAQMVEAFEEVEIEARAYQTAVGRGAHVVGR